jgi:hypothetical protein
MISSRWSWRVGVALAAVLIGSCGSDVAGPIETDVPEVIPEVQPDIPFVPPDDVPTVDLPGFDAAEVAFDGGDAGKPFGDWNKPCAGNEDCESGYCIQLSEEESVCTITCVEAPTSSSSACRRWVIRARRVRATSTASLPATSACRWGRRGATA